MRRILNNAKILLGLLALGALVMALVLIFGGQGGSESVARWVFQSLGGTPTQPPYPPPGAPTPQPTPQPTSARLPYPPPGTPSPQPTLRPTSTRPPAPPTSTATPTFTPAPPTATPAPLPPLVPGLQTFVYATTGERYPEIYRIQVDLASHTVKSIHLMHTAELWYSRTYLLQLFPSPDGKRIAFAWTYGDVGSYVSILNVDDGRVTPLFGEETEINQSAIFLDWSPDGSSVLALVGGGNPDLGWSIWLVDVDTHSYSELPIMQRAVGPTVTSASFSPDGEAIVYAQSICYQCGSEVWHVVLDGSARQLLFKDSEFRVEDVRWSPEGSYIAFTKWRESADFHEFALGELWVMKVDGSERRLLSPAVTGVYKQFVPTWSPDGQRIAFIQGTGTGKELAKLSGNGCAVDIRDGTVKQLSGFRNAQVLNPAWSPNGTYVVFTVRQDISSEQFEPWVAVSDARDLYRLDKNAALVMNSRKSNPLIVWLPSGGEGP